MTKLLFLAAFSCALASGAGVPNAAAIWQIRTDGADTNGGAFVPGLNVSSMDYSTAATPAFSGTDLATGDGLSVPCHVSSLTHTFTVQDIGNVLYISAGASWTTGNFNGRYVVTAIVGVTATLDRACSSVINNTGGTWALGGALQTPANTSNAAAVAGMTVCVLNGTYTITSGLNAAADVVWVGYSSAPCAYGNTGTKPLFQGGASSLVMVAAASSRVVMYNFVFDGGNPTFTTVSATSGGVFDNCVFRHFDATSTNAPIFLRSVATLNSTSVFVSSSSWCEAYLNTATPFSITLGLYNISHDNSGTTTDGFIVVGTGALTGNVSYNNGRHGFNLGTTIVMAFTNNIAEANAQGLNSVVAAASGFGYFYTGRDHLAYFNASFNNKSGASSPGNLTIANNDIILTGSPFASASTGDFTLNSAAGAGAALRNLGYPATMPSGSANYLSVGALQPAPGGTVSTSVTYATVQ